MSYVKWLRDTAFVLISHSVRVSAIAPSAAN